MAAERIAAYSDSFVEPSFDQIEHGLSNVGAQRRTPAPFLIRYSLEFVAGLATLFVLQAGLAPFDLVLRLPSIGANLVSAVPESAPGTGLPDIIANIFLFFPIGILWHAVINRRVRNGVIGFAVTVFLAGTLSGLIEWLQVFSPQRITSLADLVSNIIGAALGSIVFLLSRRMVPTMMGAILYEIRSRPASAIVKGYCALLFVLAAVPFSFSFDVSRLKQCVQTAILVPFAEAAPDAALRQALDSRGDHLGLAHVQWRRMKRWSGWAAEAASFAVFAWLLYPALRNQYRFHRGAAVFLTCWLGVLLAMGLGLVQFLVVTRGLDATHFVFRLLGTGVGLFTCLTVFRPAEADDNPPDRLRVVRFARIGACATAAYLFYNGVIPLLFDAQPGRLVRSLSADAFIPFVAYFVARFDVMMLDVMEKVGAYAVLAGLWSTGWHTFAEIPLRSRLSRAAMIGLTLSILIELIQVFIPVRVPSLTDPILALAGSVLGVLIQQHVVMVYRFASTFEMLGPIQAGRDHRRRRTLSLTDRLIGSLADPFDQAPSEPNLLAAPPVVPSGT